MWIMDSLIKLLYWTWVSSSNQWCVRSLVIGWVSCSDFTDWSSSEVCHRYPMKSLLFFLKIITYYIKIGGHRLEYTEENAMTDIISKSFVLYVYATELIDTYQLYT